jgi:hypothetical protein
MSSFKRAPAVHRKNRGSAAAHWWTCQHPRRGRGLSRADEIGKLTKTVSQRKPGILLQEALKKKFDPVG